MFVQTLMLSFFPLNKLTGKAGKQSCHHQHLSLLSGLLQTNPPHIILLSLMEREQFCPCHTATKGRKCWFKMKSLMLSLRLLHPPKFETNVIQAAVDRRMMSHCTCVTASEGWLNVAPYCSNINQAKDITWKTIFPRILKNLGWERKKNRNYCFKSFIFFTPLFSILNLLGEQIQNTATLYDLWINKTNPRHNRYSIWK